MVSLPYNDVNVAKIVEHLARGEIASLPTETVYGLAADATNGEAVAKVFAAKGRPSFNPLIVHVNSLEMAKAHGWFSPLAERLAEQFWPGPLTMVLPLLPQSPLHPLVTAKLGTVGLRHPRGAMAEVISSFQTPLAAPSANLSGRVSSTTASAVSKAFPDMAILDGGSTQVGLESTIVSVLEDRLVLLRPGAITQEALLHASQVQVERHTGDTIKAPGMMKSHYAPRARVVLNQKTVSADKAYLGFGDFKGETAARQFNLSQNGNLIEAAANLYRALDILDGELDILVAPIPNEGIGVAINDRLARAAAPRFS